MARAAAPARDRIVSGEMMAGGSLSSAKKELGRPERAKQVKLALPVCCEFYEFCRSKATSRRE
jgi:hypothetical protein